jgi:hypothetical protein
VRKDCAGFRIDRGVDCRFVHRSKQFVCAAAIVEVRMAIDNHPFTKGLPFICSTLVFAAERGFNPPGGQ